MTNFSLHMFCLLSNLPGPPSIRVQNMTFQMYPVDRKHCPPVDPNRDVIFHLYTNSNPVESQILKAQEDDLLSSSYMDFGKPTVIFFHGFLESHTSEDSQSIKNAYIQRGGYNIILVQAERLLGGPEYIHAAGNCKPIGKFAAGFIDYLVTKGLSLKKLHVIGFSLGAQIAGFVGKSVKSGKLTRITALEPAGPLFTTVGPADRISPDDAYFVDVIHSNIKVFGMKYSVGHVDFWPNGGGPGQPGCSRIDVVQKRGIVFDWLVFCEHYRAYQLYAISVVDPHAFPSQKCESNEEFKAGTCKDDLNFLGFAASPSSPGDFYLKTIVGSNLQMFT